MPEHRVDPEQRVCAGSCGRSRPRWKTCSGASCAGRRLEKWKFRRQVPVEGYVVDFFCTARAARRGGGRARIMHAGAAGERCCADAVLRRHGLRVLRFSGDLILSDLARVVEEIRRALRQAPSSDP
jgi:very-short-patch-repair endonuclease